ncbi:MAG: agmatine deiminase [Firmicutes bacterium]|nr:agmatine deiminase [Bacillota bacterium]
MPAEFAPHRGTIMIFPERPGSWPHNAEPAAKIFVNIITQIAKDEEVFVLVSKNTREKAKNMLKNVPNVTFYEIEQDDAWARDTAPTFVTNGCEIRGVDWRFNAWGGEFDGLYAHWEKDDALAANFCENAGYKCYNAKHFVLEGGSVHSDGEGTLLVTEACLLSKGRNPDMTKEEIDKNLCEYLGAEKVIWLPRGIYNDETNEHVDNICAFIAPAEVVLAWTNDESDPQYPLSKACLDSLLNETDAKGRKIAVHKLPIPAVPVCVTADDMDGYIFEEGEDTREVGERLAASYVNFYFSNTAVILPQFGGENKKSDKLAADILKKLCPNRRIVPIQAREIIVGGGNIHCITQQVPK